LLRRRYPASSLLRASPPPRTAEPAPRGVLVAGHAPTPPGLPVFRVTSSCRHAVATTPVGSQGIHRSVFRLSAGGTRPRDSSLRRQITGSAPTLRISRLAQRSLLLRPVDSLTPQGSFFLKCFSPIRYLLEPPQALPAGTTSRRAGFAPAGNNTTFHGTQFDFRHENPGMQISGKSAIVLGVTVKPRKGTFFDTDRDSGCRTSSSSSVHRKRTPVDRSCEAPRRIDCGPFCRRPRYLDEAFTMKATK
jgi:hypothetical protein